MSTMRAFRLLSHRRAEIVDVPVPKPGPDQVRVRVAGVGLCHTDIDLMDAAPGVSRIQPPFTLGHEIAGWVDDVGPEVTGLSSGEPVLAVAHDWCGTCSFCARGLDNHCAFASLGTGYGTDGGLADYVLVAGNSLLPIPTLDPRTAGPLADAAATPYHAVACTRSKLVPGTQALVIGAGGLGGYAIQWLRLLTDARVVAADISPDRRDLAVATGAHESVEPAALDQLGADVVYDFVGSQETVDIAVRSARPGGAVVIVGGAGGQARVGWGMLPADCTVNVSLASTVADLRAVVAAAEQGRLSMPCETYPFDEVQAGYDALRAGTLVGRAVVTLD